MAAIILLTITGQSAKAKTKEKRSGKSQAGIKYISRTRPRLANPSAITEARLYAAIQERLGLPYRTRGTDNRGYDCSGFVWRVFQEAGIDFERSSARTLWQNLPEADEDEKTNFGTLVFFKGLNHVGVVRDAYSFYHVSSTKGVVRSFYSEYWGNRVIGFRRIK
jgi:cell wall-associated NlpC family hydrolase